MDMTTSMDETINNHSAILKELSDMKASLAVNTNETKNIREGVSEIREGVKDLGAKVGIQNGRVRTLEDWSNEARKIIESNNGITKNYSMDKAKLWVAISLLLFFGGTIIGLSIKAIDNKIEKEIDRALSEYEITNDTNIKE